MLLRQIKKEQPQMFQKQTIMLYQNVDKMFPGQKYVKYCQNPHIWLYPKGGSFMPTSLLCPHAAPTHQNKTTSLKNIWLILNKVCDFCCCPNYKNYFNCSVIFSVKWILLHDACFKTLSTLPEIQFWWWFFVYHKKKIRISL